MVEKPLLENLVDGFKNSKEFIQNSIIPIYDRWMPGGMYHKLFWMPKSRTYKTLFASALVGLSVASMSNVWNGIVSAAAVGFSELYRYPTRKNLESFLSERVPEAKLLKPKTETKMVSFIFGSGLLLLFGKNFPEQINQLSTYSFDELSKPIATAIESLAGFRAGYYIIKGTGNIYEKSVRKNAKHFFPSLKAVFSSKKKSVSMNETLLEKGYIDSLSDLSKTLIEQKKYLKAISIIITNQLIDKKKIPVIDSFATNKEIIYDELVGKASSLNKFVTTLAYPWALDKPDDNALSNYYADKAIEEARRNDDISQLSLFSLYKYMVGDERIDEHFIDLVKRLEGSAIVEDKFFGEGSIGVNLPAIKGEEENPLGLVLVKKSLPLEEKLAIEEEYVLTSGLYDSLDGWMNLIVPKTIYQGSSEELNQAYYFMLRYYIPRLDEVLKSNPDKAHDILLEVANHRHELYFLLQNQEKVSFKPLDLELKLKNNSTTKTDLQLDNRTIEILNMLPVESWIPLIDHHCKNSCYDLDTRTTLRFDFQNKGLGPDVLEIVNTVESCAEVVDKHTLDSVRMNVLAEHEELYNLDRLDNNLLYVASLAFRTRGFFKAWSQPNRTEDSVRIPEFGKHIYTVLKELENNTSDKTYVRSVMKQVITL